MAFWKGGKPYEFGGVRYDRLDHRVEVDMPLDDYTGYGSTNSCIRKLRKVSKQLAGTCPCKFTLCNCFKSSAFDLIKWTACASLKIIDYVVSNILRIQLFVYWRAAGRLPDFTDSYFQMRVERLNQDLQAIQESNTRALRDNGQLNEEINHNREVVGHLEKENESLRVRVHTIENEKQEALTRLSEVVSVKLRDNNPNIVDLNDQCRPTKLAEMFSELYDNEWTGAYTMLEEPFGEENSIVILLDIIMEAYGFCEEKVEAPWKTLMEWFLDMSLPGAQQTSKWLKDSRKAKIKSKVQEVEKDFEQRLLKTFKDNKYVELLLNTEMKQYITKCVELCLLMVATDPPVILNCPGWSRGSENQEHGNMLSAEEKQCKKENNENNAEKDSPCLPWGSGEGRLFDKELYKEYTTRGTYLDFIVWPALFLHEEGPMLSKGIAQGRKEPKSGTRK